MSNVQEIEAAIDGLSRRELFGLVDRLRTRHADAWDLQIEEDAASGKLEALFARLEREDRGQPEVPLDEILDDRQLS